MKNPQFVYHRRSPEFVGDIIYPLNQLKFLSQHKSCYEKIHVKEQQKYNTREWTKQIRIPVFENSYWNDVIFLSPIHPHHIYREYKKSGLMVDQFHEISQYFKIPASRLNEAKTTVWLFTKYSETPNDAQQCFEVDTFQKFELQQYRELKTLPEDTISYYKDFISSHPMERPRYTFFKIPHVMTTEPINVADVETIDWRESFHE